MISFIQKWFIENGNKALGLAWSQARAHRQILLIGHDHISEGSIVLQQRHRIRFINRFNVRKSCNQLNKGRHKQNSD